MKPVNRLLLPFLFIFLFINLAILLSWKLLISYGVNIYAIAVANVLLLAICLLVFFLQKKALANPNPNVFVRSIMSGMIIKMFVCLAAIMIYKFAGGSSFDKKAVIISMLLYLIYLSAEVKVILTLNKKPNA